jgi:hypothetical protein
MPSGCISGRKKESSWKSVVDVHGLPHGRRQACWREERLGLVVWRAQDVDIGWGPIAESRDPLDGILLDRAE